MKLKNVLIVGMGVMGRQIALQSARFGYNVALFDVDRAALAHWETQREELLSLWMSQGIATASEATAIRRRITPWPDAAAAAEKADLLIECVPESLDAKLETFARFEPLCPPHALFATNASFLTPSMLLDAVARRPLFAALHFYEPVWHARVADVMPHPETAATTIDALVDFARSLQMIPIVCHTERPGYVGNAMVQAVLGAAIDLAADGAASFQDVDRAWMGVMKTAIGPFGILDRIGIDTVYDVTRHWLTVAPTPSKLKRTEFLERQIAAGRLGLKSGRGFYSYPAPEFERPGFLQGKPAAQDAGAPPSAADAAVAETVLVRYLYRVAAPVAFAMHAAAHGLFAWLVLSGGESTPVLGAPSLAVVAMISAAVACSTAVIAGNYVAIAVLVRMQESAAVTNGLLPSPAMLRHALAAGAAGAAVVAAAAFVIWLLHPDAVLPRAWAVIGNGLAAGVAGLAVQTATALRFRRQSRLDAALR